MSLKFKTKVDASLGHQHIEKAMSFGMDSHKLTYKSANFDMNAGEVNGSLLVGDNKLGGSINGSLKVGNLEGGYSIDYTEYIPKYSIRAGADVAKLNAEGNYIKSGIEHKIASVELNGPGVNMAAGVGGKTILPNASMQGHSNSAKFSIGVDKLQPNLNASGGKIEGLLSGVGRITKNADGSIDGRADLGVNSLLNGKDYGKSFIGKGGTEKGTAKEIYSSRFNRNNLLNDANHLHNKNSKKINRFEGKNGLFANRNYNNIADKSKTYTDKIDAAMGQILNEKQNIDNKLGNPNLDKNARAKLAEQSKSLGDEYGKFEQARNKLKQDGDISNNRMHRDILQKDVKSKSTDQIVKDANRNVNRFQNAYDHHGWNKSIGGKAADLCSSKNELNNRVDLCDQKMEKNNGMIEDIQRNRDAYLNEKGMSLKDAIDKKDPRVMEYNEGAANLRKENQGLRDEKGECQKALLETDKNFEKSNPSEVFHKEDRKLQGEKIDNDNAIATKNDEIANYCDNNGIMKDKDGNYHTPNAKQDERLDKLLNDKKEIENNGKHIEKEKKSNDDKIKQSEKLGSKSVKVTEDDKGATVKMVDDRYIKRAEGEKEGGDKDNESEKNQTKDNQKSDDSQLNQTNDNQKDNDSQLNQTKDNQKSDDSQLNQTNDNQKDNDSQLNQTDNNQKSDDSQLKQTKDNQKSDDSQLNQTNNNQKGNDSQLKQTKDNQKGNESQLKQTKDNQKGSDSQLNQTKDNQNSDESQLKQTNNNHENVATDYQHTKDEDKKVSASEHGNKKSNQRDQDSGENGKSGMSTTAANTYKPEKESSSAMPTTNEKNTSSNEGKFSSEGGMSTTANGYSQKENPAYKSAEQTKNSGQSM